jgi:hypothetical protein
VRPVERDMWRQDGGSSQDPLRVLPLGSAVDNSESFMMVDGITVIAGQPRSGECNKTMTLLSE